jgi:hypothetical protein
MIEWAQSIDGANWKKRAAIHRWDDFLIHNTGTYDDE